jgi:poly(3-hydroxybutyrate) depolymerase
MKTTLLQASFAMHNYADVARHFSTTVKRFAFVLLLAMATYTAANADVIPDEPAITVDGLNRTYKKYVPATLNVTKPVLLIVSMHGIGGTSDFFFSGADVRPMADALNAIVVSPQAFPEQNETPAMLNAFPDAAAAFNSFAAAAWGCGLSVVALGTEIFEFNKDIADENFIRQVIVETQAAHPAIENKNVFLLGTSMGAFMGNQYAEKYDDFGGFISVVGSRGLKINSTSHVTGAIPVCLFNSESDELVGYSGSAILGGIPVTICESIDDVVNNWKQRNGLLLATGTSSSFPAGSNGNNTATKTVYGSGSNEVVFYKMQQVSHATYLSTANGDCIDYNTEIRKFIESHVTGSDGIKAVESAKVWSYGSELHLYSLQAGEAWIYSLKGQLVKKLIYKAGETVSTSLAKGVYIVRIDEKTWKVMIN